MPPVSLACPNCQGTFESAAAAGQQVFCPHCRRPVTVPGAAPEAPTWFLARDNQRYGPYDLPRLKKMVDGGQVQTNDLVWKEGMPNWVEAGTLPELFSPRDARTQPGPVPVSAAPEPQYAASGAGAFLKPGGGGAFWSFVGVSLRRACAWNLDRVPVTEAEKERLAARGVDNETAQKYLVWRRSVFLLVGIITSVSALLYIINSAVQGYKGMSTLGVFTEIVRMLSHLAMPTAAILACVAWARVRLSRNLILVGWAVSFLIPLLLALLPLHWLFDIPGTATAEASSAPAAIANILGVLMYSMMLMPTVLSLLPGVLRACVRLKALLPESILPGWLLIASIPLYALLSLVMFVTVNQMVGNALLILSVLLLMGAPAIYLTAAGLFIRPLAEDRERRKIGYLQIVYSSIAGLAGALLIVYLLTGTILGTTLVGFSSETSLIRPWSVLQLYLEFLGRSLFTSTLVADLFMLMNVSVWHHLRQFGKTEHAAKYDQLMGKLGEVLHKN